MADLFPPTIDELIACAQREANLRAIVYPRRVALKRMTQEKAEREIALMLAIVEELKRRA